VLAPVPSEALWIEHTQTIDAEGIDNLQDAELAQACQSRGIRTSDKSLDDLRAELAQWIDLHLHRNLSGTLLFLCKAFSFTQEGTDPTENMIASIKDVLSSLPDELVSETELDISDDKATAQQRLEVLEQQEDLIEDEAEQEAREQEARRVKKEAEAAKKEEEAAARAAAEEARTDEPSRAEADAHRIAVEAPASSIDSIELQSVGAATSESTLAAETMHSESHPEAESRALDVAPPDARMTSEQLAELGSALSILSAKSSVLRERADLKALMEAHRSSTVSDEATAAASEGEPAEPAEEDKQSAADAKRKADLSKRIGKMIQQARHDPLRCSGLKSHRPAHRSTSSSTSTIARSAPG
jgi:LETM1 and EF-hand domain-containing protein 1